MCTGSKTTFTHQNKNMEQPTEDEVTKFKLKFPANRNFIIDDSENIEQRQCLYIGECVEVLCFAKYNGGNASEAVLQRWSKNICSLQAFTTASAHVGDGVEITNDADVRNSRSSQGGANHERPCRPFTVGMSNEMKVICASA